MRRRAALLFVFVTSVLVSPGVARTAAVCDGAFHPYRVPLDLQIADMSLIDGTDGWAVGTHDERAIALRWSASGWRQVPLAEPRTVYPYDVAAVDADRAWAVGPRHFLNGGDRGSMIQRWNGTEWRVVTPPLPGGRTAWLQSVTATSRADVWVAGGYIDARERQQLLLLHWDGDAWVRVPVDEPKLSSGTPLMIYGIDAGAPDDVWLAAGNAAPEFAMRYDGVGWTVVAYPDLPVDRVYTAGIDVSDGETWIVMNGAGVLFTGAMRWTGSAWEVVPVPDPESGSLWDVAVLGSGHVLAVGGISGGFLQPGYRWALEWDGLGWSEVGGPLGGQKEGGLQEVEALGTGEVLISGKPKNDFTSAMTWFSCPV